MFTTRLVNVVGLCLSACIAGLGCAHRYDPVAARRHMLAEVSEGHPFGERPPPIPSDAEIHRLTPEQEQAFISYFRSAHQAETAPHMRVFNFLETKITKDFSYQGDTQPAYVTFSTRSGNCMSLAVLTTALARLVKLGIGYHLMDSTPVFELRNDIVYRGQHIRTIIYDPDWEPTDLITMTRPAVGIDYFPTGSDYFVRDLAPNEYLAKYYENLAAEAIAAGGLDRAYWLLRRALEVAPDDAEAINALAVVFRRAGDVETAETLFQYGIRFLPNKITLLRNYRYLLRQLERLGDVEDIDDALADLEDQNPIDWLFAGRAAYAQGNHREAIRFFAKASRAAPYLHDAYFGLAASYYRLGEHDRAERQLKTAIGLAERSQTESLYRAKLEALRRSR